MSNEEAVFCIGMDAFRIARGIKPKHFTREQVIEWLRIAPQGEAS